MGNLSPAQVQALQRKYSGLDSDLAYLPGHTIHNRYNDYKTADTQAGAASKTYKNTSSSLKKSKPYSTSERPTGPIAGAMYDKAGHRTLAPLAENASKTAGVHAERRETFNRDYRDVLEAKGNYVSHEGAAKEARNSQKKYDGFYQKHQKWL